jgi:hypothetical protein
MGARNQLINLEGLSDEDLKNLEKQFERVRRKAERDGESGRLSRGSCDDCPLRAKVYFRRP